MCYVLIPNLLGMTDARQDEYRKMIVQTINIGAEDEIFGLLIGDVAGVPGAARHMSIISITIRSIQYNSRHIYAFAVVEQ